MSASTRRALFVYATLVLLLNVAVALPGNPYYSSAWGFVGSILLQSLLVWGVWRGSSLAWCLAFATALLTVVALALIGGPYDLGTILVVVISIAQTTVLAAPPITGFIWPRRETPAASR